MNRGLYSATLATACLLAAALGCRPDRETKSLFPRDQTVYLGGPQWGEPASFNPLSSSPDWPLKYGMNLLYEQLFVFDYQSGRLEPLLGKSYEVSETSITVELNPAARWSDGKPVTGFDVKYTFDLGKEHKSLPVAPIWQYLSRVVLPQHDQRDSDAPKTIVFELNRERLNPLVVLDAIQSVPIVPKHIILPLLKQAGNDINRFLKLKFDKNPVVSGPYTLHSYSSEKIAAVRRDDYWGNAVFFGGKKPVAKYVVHPIYKSNDHFSVALQQGHMDISSTFMPRIWLKHKKGVRSWYDEPPYFLSGSIPLLFVNVQHQPLGDVHMRRAMAFSVNYKDIRELAVSGYSDPLKPGLILPFGLEQKYYSPIDAKRYGASRYDPNAARAELRAGGYRPVWDEDNKLLETRDKTGKKVPTVFIKSPTGWTDWESIVRIAVKSMRSVGIDVRERFIDASLFFNAVFTGDFDLIMYTPTSMPTPSMPWSRFEAILTSKEWKPEGEKIYKNMGRFNNPNSADYIARFDELLDLIPTLKDEAAVKKAYRELNVLVMKHQPVIPLVYRADRFYEFSERVWKGFPTSKNPYLPPQIPGDRLGTRMLWRLKPTGARD